MFLCILTNALYALCTRCARCMRFVRAAQLVSANCAARCMRYALQKKISAHLCAYFLKLLYSFVNCVQRV